MTGFDLRVLSLGAGVQSTGMYLMALDGLFPVKPDVAIIADTQQEPPWVYENIWRLAREGGSEIPIVVATAGDMGDACAPPDNGKRYASVPFWVAGDDGRAAPGRRQCTGDYKIDAVVKAIRTRLGLAPRQRAAGKFSVEQWIGISLDEASRAKPARQKWIQNRWPLLYDVPVSRQGITDWLSDRGWPTVGKSACIQCPWRGAAEYADWRENHPGLFEEACRWDERIRDGRKSRGIERPQYILRTLQPLRDLPPIEELLRDDSNQLNLFENECEGMCGV